jgi:pSer/pThr/pTyr-binding forkhead associated (FHA) protein
MHAVLEWFHDGWQLRDLSRNGTWLNGARVKPAENIPLTLGDTFCLGARDGSAWELVDDVAPCSLLLAESSRATTLPLTSYLFLPDEAHPQLVIHYSNLRRSWMYHTIGPGDRDPPEYPLQHNQRMEAAGQAWRVFLADSASATELVPGTSQRLADFEFLYDLSLDEEITRLRLRREEREIDLGERSHHYLLLHLARHRAEEAAAGLDGKSQGWVDTDRLARELGVDHSHLNILIFRARKQISEQLPTGVDSEPLVERRKGQVRFGCPRFVIFKGEQMTHALPLSPAGSQSRP